MKNNNVSKIIKRIVKFAIVFAMVVGFIQPGQASMASAKAVKISQSKLELTIGQKKTLKVNGTKEKATWSSSNKKVATVGKTNGKVTAVSAGNATITAKVGKKQYKCKVTIKPFKTQKVTLSNNTTFELPKEYTYAESSLGSIVMVQIMMDPTSNSNIVYTNTPFPIEISDKDFIETMKTQLTKEAFESQLQMQLNSKDLKVDNFEVKEQKVGKKKGIVVSYSFEINGISMTQTQYNVNFGNSYVALVVTDVDGCGNKKDVVEWIVNTLKF